MLALVFMLGMFVFPEAGSMKGVVVCKVCFGFSAIHGTLLFHLFRFFGRKF